MQVIFAASHKLAFFHNFSYYLFIIYSDKIEYAHEHILFLFLFFLVSEQNFIDSLKIWEGTALLMTNSRMVGVNLQRLPFLMKCLLGELKARAYICQSVKGPFQSMERIGKTNEFFFLYSGFFSVTMYFCPWHCLVAVF